ncbi:MAG TPA: hypothetical protein VFU76_11650 [Terriglobales bacterium]|nr:hypothetical protein [Terriglobales bacterium]
MADYVNTYPADARQRGASWSAIFAGAFVFIAVMATFEALGIAIFGGSAPGALATGLTVWTTVLGIISLTLAGRAAGRLSYSVEKSHATYIGLVTFGLSVFATILVVALVATAVGANNPGTQVAGWPANIFAAGGYGTFVSLVLGMIGCVLGARGAVPAAGAPAVEAAPNLRRIA